MGPRFLAAPVLVSLAAVAPAFGHHALQVKFDVTKSLTLKGLITKVEWVNPHVYLYLDVNDEHGAVSKWALESPGAGRMQRGGVTQQMLVVGDPVTVVAYHAKDGLNLAFVRKIKFADGREVQLGLGDPSGRR